MPWSHRDCSEGIVVGTVGGYAETPGHDSHIREVKPEDFTRFFGESEEEVQS